MKPTLAVSMGDPAGIGPEVIVAAAARSSVRRACRLIVFGDAACLRRARRACDLSARGASAITEVRQVGRLRHDRRPAPGVAGGRLAFAYLDAAARAVAAGAHDALVTAPLNKRWVRASVADFSGHTGYLSELAGCEAVMMLCGRRLRVVPVTTHLAHRDVASALTAPAIRRAATTTAEHLARYHGVHRPTLAIAALNPHAGEGGLFGDEEKRILGPAVRSLQRRGLDVRGPLAADTLFAAALDGTYDAVICMYHDQALIPLKLVDFGRAVNVSMGLPFIRTSPDHGTAYELAGSGRADAGSMTEAILLAARMAHRVE